MRAASILIALVLLVPIALAHVDHDRPSIQVGQPIRRVSATLEKNVATIDFEQVADPLRQFIRHTVDPAGIITVAHRPHLSAPDGAVKVEWQITRLLEYRDSNQNGQFESGFDPTIKAWRLSSYKWDATGIRSVTAGGVRATENLWSATLSDGPSATLEFAAAGRAFGDEGARVRAQDTLIYLEWKGVPARGVGNLHAIEGEVITSPHARVHRDQAPNVTVGFYVDEGDRRAFFTWGGEAVVDGKEKLLGAFLGEPVARPDGNLSWPYRISIPAMEKGARFVIVSGIEYPFITERTPWPGAGLVIVAGLLAAVGSAFARRSR